MNFRLIISIAVLTLTACSGSSDTTTATDPTALVELAKAQSGSIASKQTVYGAIELNADTQYTLSAPVEAVVDRIAAPVGSPIRRGQVVIALAPSPTTRSDMAQLSAEARSTQQAYERAQRLRTDGLASDAEVEAARTTAEAAEASRAALATQTRQLALGAPGSGFVQSISSNPGDLVSAGTTVATISRTGDLRARFGIDPAMLAHLSRGSGVRVDTGGDSPVKVLPIRAVDPSVDPQTRLASIYVTVPTGQSGGAGQPLKGDVTLEQSGNAVLVPYSALLDDGGQPFVFVVSQGVAGRKDVVVGASDGTSVAIAEGITAGDEVVVQGGTALEDGMKVRTK